MLLGIDTGGTFTDFILYRDGELATHKVLSTPAAPEQAILQGINELGIARQDLSLNIVHGSTVATNALLESKGVKTAYITNQGFADVLSIGRQTRKSLYNLQPAAVVAPVAAEFCLEINTRVTAQGETVEALTEEDISLLLQQLKQLQPEAVAINLLFSYLDDSSEKRIADAINAGPAGYFVSRSSAVLAEYKEYERGIATWLNSYVGPLVEGYLSRLQQGSSASIAIMQSSGGTIAAEHAGQQAVHMLLSGPAGGLAAAKFIGEITGQSGLLTFDMGGTSTDVALVDVSKELQLTSEGEIAGYPVAVPMVDMHTIGAGGGSIAYVDEGGVLQVGPESAGADPGPACYGKGGKQVTVTDANLILGRLRADAFLGGGMQLDVDAANQAIASLAQQLNLSAEQTAQGIIRIANEHMVQALRVMSVQRGIDPRELTLASFGGAGGLHVCALAQALDMKQAIVPIHSGVLSALGMLVAPRSRQLSQTITGLLDEFNEAELVLKLDALADKGSKALIDEGMSKQDIELNYSVDLRYAGQAYYLTVDWESIQKSKQAFHALHEKRYGHQLELPVELVNVRVALFCQAEPLQLKNVNTSAKACTSVADELHSMPVYQRENLSAQQVINGPALITEKVSTTLIEAGWRCQVHSSGCLMLERISGE